MDAIVSNTVKVSNEETNTFVKVDTFTIHNLENDEVDQVSDETPVLESDSIQTVSWSEICRICGKISEHVVPMFGGENDAEHEISTIINRHLPIHVEETDTLPTQLCYDCATIVMSWDDLFTNCLDVQSNLELMHEEWEKIKSENYEQCDEEIKENIEKENSAMETVKEQSPVKNESCNSLLSCSEKSLDKTIEMECCDLDQSHHPPNAIKSEVPENQDLANSPNTSDIMDTDNWEPMDSNSNLSEDEPAIPKKRKRAKNDFPIECQICNKILGNKRSLAVHLRTHTGEKPFTCKICGKQYSQSGSYYYHLKHVHGGEKKHECKDCGRKFALKTALNDHERTHDGMRPLACPDCEKTFKTKAALYVHSRMHKKEQYYCDLCEKSFRWRQQLLTHSSLEHTGRKEYPCDLCDMEFCAKYDLTRHKFVHSNEKPFECEKCRIKFRQKRYLKNHTLKYCKGVQSSVSSPSQIQQSDESNICN